MNRYHYYKPYNTHFDLEADDFTKNYNYYCGIFVAGFGMVLGFGTFLVLLFTPGAGMASIVGLLWGAPMAYLFHKFVIKPKKDFEDLKAQYIAYKEREKKRQLEMFKRDFYKTCLEKGVKSDSTRGECEKIKLIGLQYTNTISANEWLEIYKESVKIHNAEARREHLNALTKEENAIISDNNKFKDCIGIQKIIKYCTESAQYYRRLAAEYKRKRDQAIDTAIRAYGVLKEHETSWGLMGGIAEGLGGVGAGISAAVDTQISNAGVRQRNAQLQNNLYGIAANVELQYSNSQYDAAHTAEILEKRAKEYEIKLIENGDAQKYMKLLNPMSVAVTKRETGNALIEITVDSADFCIFDNIPAVVDGCLEAIVKNGSGTTVGKAYITLPIYGVLRKTNLRGVANLHKGANTDSLSITFKPYHLWAMEK